MSLDRKRSKNRNRKLRQRLKKQGKEIEELKEDVVRIIPNKYHAKGGDGRHRMQNVSFKSLLSRPLQSFCEAVTNPFGNGALGAVLPDNYNDLTIPVSDRAEFDLDYTSVNFSGHDWYADAIATSPATADDAGFYDNAAATIQLLGIYIWFQPRCVQSSLLDTCIVNDSSFAVFRGSAPKYPYTVTGELDEAFADKLAIMDEYVLCYTGYWYINNGAPRDTSDTEYNYTGYAAGLYYKASDSGTVTERTFPHVFGYRVVPYPRIENIADNISKARILGAGLKVWSEEAPINTGGYVVGGWTTFDDLLPIIRNTSYGWGDGSGTLSSTAYYTQLVTSLSNSGSATNDFIPSLKGACRETGVGGVTVRYSPLQTAEQLEKERVMLDGDDANFSYVTDWDPSGESTGVNYVNIHPSTGSDLSAFDVITRGSYIPALFWKWNVDLTADEPIADLYTLRVMSMVHLDGQPLGTSPFMSQNYDCDPASAHVKLLMENWSVFPPAVSGHTFKSFMTKASHVTSKMVKGAGHVLKILNLVDKFATQVGKIGSTV